MNKTYEALAFDIDGTLLNSNYKINSSTLLAIKRAKEQGLKIIFCSGRSYLDMKHLETEYQIADYMVCNNGTYFFDVKMQQFYFNQTISHDLAKQIINEGKNMCGLLALHTENGTFRTRLCGKNDTSQWLNNALEDDAQMFLTKYNTPLSKVLKELDRAKIIAQVAFHLDVEKAQNFAQSLKNKHQNLVNVTVASRVYVDVNPLNVNKFLGLKTLARIINLDPALIVAFGDSDNDLEMLAQIGYGICMGNGTELAKLSAKEVIGSNDSDALAIKINQILD